MAKKEIKKTVCSFCIELFPTNDLYVVDMPMHRLPEGGYRDVYRTPCCKVCLKREKGRYLSVHEEPKSIKKK